MVTAPSCRCQRKVAELFRRIHYIAIHYGENGLKVLDLFVRDGEVVCGQDREVSELTGR